MVVCCVVLSSSCEQIATQGLESMDGEETSFVYLRAVSRSDFNEILDVADAL